MPIGKNAIKRVSSSGYSNVQTTAPDMENSVVAKAEEAPKVEAPAVAEPVLEKATPRKTAKKPAKKTAPRTQEKQGFVHLAIGDDLPYYLL